MCTFISIPVASLRRSLRFRPISPDSSIQEGASAPAPELDRFNPSKSALCVQWDASSHEDGNGQSVLFQSALPKVGAGPMTLTLGARLKGVAVLETRFYLDNKPVVGGMTITGTADWDEDSAELVTAGTQARTVTVEIVMPDTHPQVQLSAIWLVHSIAEAVPLQKETTS